MTPRLVLACRISCGQNASDFAKICELNFDKKDELVPFYPATMFLYPTVCLLSSRKYLFPVLGAIHVRNYFRFQKPLKSTEAYKVRIASYQYQVLALAFNIRFLRLDKGSHALLCRALVSNRGC